MGELTVAESPDCDGCPKEYRRKPAEIIIHEKYDFSDSTSPYDIALIRVAQPMTLFELGQPVWMTQVWVNTNFSILNLCFLIFANQRPQNHHATFPLF